MTDTPTERLVDTLLLKDWRPRPQTVTDVTPVPRPAVPVVDAHNHVGRWLSPDGGWLVDDVPALMRVLDDHDVATLVNLDGRWGDELTANLDRYDRTHPGRFATFAHLDWTALRADDAAAALVVQVDDAARRGARGFKVWKDLGLTHRDGTGALVLPDDGRVVTALARAGDLGLPVLVHTADPVAFFDPLDATNERVDELGEHPDWWFGGPGLPTFARLMTALETLVAATPSTTYVGAHVGCYAENLTWVSRMLDDHPNFNVDTGGRFAELGRTPRAFRRLVERHPTRVLFGTDAYPPDATAYETAFRFLETEDEAFEYAPGESVPPQGRWTISGAGLPSSLLPLVYADNARRVFRL
ncbi:amidohydrolase family protein [Kineosporia sp. R_H_3]|uniref:amidohydrolase family protein n=1 Tax=Kineosporia sp. R_H_3 TaxID=1961848 RepID=UPI000B4BA973|nr:amidohydrolase family protein [Kineosporia sp. R_H_3]